MGVEGQATQGEARLVLGSVPAANLAMVVAEISELFGVEATFATQIVRVTPIILLDGLNAEQVVTVMANTGRLRYLGADVSIESGPIVGRIQKLNWPAPPPILKRRAVIFVCPKCGERLMVVPARDEKEAIAAPSAPIRAAAPAAVAKPAAPPPIPAAAPAAAQPAAPRPVPASPPQAPPAPQTTAARPVAPPSPAPPKPAPAAPPAPAEPAAAPATEETSATAEPLPAEEPEPGEEKKRGGLFGLFRRAPKAEEQPEEVVEAEAVAEPVEEKVAPPPAPVAAEAPAEGPVEAPAAVQLESGPYSVFAGGGLTGSRKRKAVPLIMKYRGISEADADKFTARTILVIVEGVSEPVADACVEEFREAGLSAKKRKH